MDRQRGGSEGRRPTQPGTATHNGSEAIVEKVGDRQYRLPEHGWLVATTIIDWEATINQFTG